MSKNNVNSGKKKLSISSLSSNNKVVFLFSLILAIVFWCIVSMSETTETERVFQDVIVKINMEGSLPQNNNLEIFGQKEFKVNVTVKGLSYLVNDSSFTNDDIFVTASCSSVAEPGTYNLPLSFSVNPNLSGSVEVVNASAQSINVTFDRRETKTFYLTEDIVEGDNFSVGENITMENPVLSVDKIDITGPSADLSRISSVLARVVLNSEINSSLSLEAEIVAMSSSGVVDLSNCTIEQTEPVYVSISVKKTGTYKTSVEFRNIPPAYRTSGINYSISPEMIDVKVDVNSETADDTISVGVIDFSELSYGVNTIMIENKDLLSDVKNFVVTVDMTGLTERWISDIPVNLADINIPENVTVVSTDVDSVVIICPPDIKDTIDSGVAYAIPVFDGTEYEPGNYKVPAKIILRTLQNSWVYGNDYEIEIEVK